VTDPSVPHAAINSANAGLKILIDRPPARERPTYQLVLLVVAGISVELARFAVQDTLVFPVLAVLALLAATTGDADEAVGRGEGIGHGN
jgi:hypothetical protein